MSGTQHPRGASRQAFYFTNGTLQKVTGVEDDFTVPGDLFLGGTLFATLPPADALASSTTTVNVSASPAPSAGNILEATSATSAQWSPPNKTADLLATTGASVDVVSGAPGIAGDILTLTSPTTAVWQAPITTATALATTGADVVVSAAAPGIAGDILTLTSPTTATWQAPAGGGGLLVAGTGTDSLKSDTGTTTSTATESIAIGVDADSTANYAIALGSHAQATGVNSIAVGGNTADATAANAASQNSIAIGNNSSSSGGANGIAIGTDTLARHTDNIAIGTSALTGTTSAGATAVGPNSIADGFWTAAYGKSADAGGNYATAVGPRANASGDYSVALGGNNLSGASATASGAIAIGGSVTANVANSFFVTSGLATLGSGTDLLFSGGQIAPLSSTLRIKENITDLPNTIVDNLRQLQPRKFTLKHEKKEAIGFIAEEVAEIAPELAEWGHWRTLDEEGQQTGEQEEELSPVGVKYRDISVALLAYVQQLEKRIEALEAK